MLQAETLYMVIPCYNEEEVLAETAGRLKEKIKRLTDRGQISAESRIVFVCDGSTDRTWEIIRDLHVKEPHMFSGIELASNSGHQNAVLAGLMTIKDICDIAITMDADLQDDIDAIDAMIEKYYEGNQVVYGVRSSRDKDTFFKRASAQSFYRFMKMMGAETIYNHADFRLMSRRVLQELAGFKEVNLFLRGLVPLIGFKSCCVYYERSERFAGESKYPLNKMMAFAINGITSFSVRPLKIITVIGLIMSIVSVVAILWSIIAKVGGFSVHGWSSTMCSIWFIGGTQLLALGIIGEYIGKIYSEVKARPRYIVADFIHDTSN